MDTATLIGEMMLNCAIIAAGLFILFWIFGSPVEYAPLFWGVFSITGVVSAIRWINDNPSR